MKRRNFCKGLLALGAGFSILPSATTYARLWTAQRKIVIASMDMPYSNRDFAGTWKFVTFESGKNEFNTVPYGEFFTDRKTMETLNL